MTFKEFKDTGKLACVITDVNTGRKEFALISHNEPPEWMRIEHEMGNYQIPQLKGCIDKLVVYTWALVIMPAYVRGKYEGDPKWGTEKERIVGKNYMEMMETLGRHYDGKHVIVKPIRFMESPYDYEMSGDVYE